MIQIVLYYHLDHLGNINITTKFFIFSNNYHCNQLNYALASQHFFIPHYVFEYYGAQFLH